MNAPYCKTLQLRLLDEGVAALGQDAEAENHLAECDECFAYLEALTQVDEVLTTLPAHEPAPDLVATTIAQVSALPAAGTRVRKRSGLFNTIAVIPAAVRPYAFAATALLALFFVVTDKFTSSAPSARRSVSSAKEAGEWSEATFNDTLLSGGTGGYAPEQDVAAGQAADGASFDQPASAPLESEPSEASVVAKVSSSNENEVKQRLQALQQNIDRMAEVMEDDGRSAGIVEGKEEQAFGGEGEYQLDSIAQAPPADKKRAKDSGLRDVRESRSERAPAVFPPQPEMAAPGKLKNNRTRDRWSPTDAFELEEQLSDADEGAVGALAPPKRQEASRSALAAEYLKQLGRTDGLSFKEPSGYWSNSYLPGDAELRSLHSSLLREDLSAVERLLRHPSGLHLDARQAVQPFDAPTDAAIAVFLQSDKASVDGPTRMTVQVGLKGTVRGQGIRPAMNMGVVVDLTGADEQRIQETIWSVAYALNELRDVGDKISLAVVGCDPSQDLGAAQFRHGYLKVLAEQAGGCGGRGGSRMDALRRVSKSVSASDDPNAPLGSSALLLVAPSAPAPDLALLEGFAHRSAVAGIPLSVIAVGESGAADFERVALAGQGSRRVLRTAAEAKELVKRELAMVGGVVARAVRLRIRLAPGVKLVDVLGSDRLDEARAQRVRDAEKSVDQRISRNLGIQADRGEDEEGIQIVIPVFMAADAHVLLLDVVVPGPGPVADVTVRFKDLAFLKNGVARANLSLSNRAQVGGEQRGALEQNVLKNRLAFDTSRLLERAAERIRAGSMAEAIELLDTQRQLLDSFAELYTGFARDADLERDRELLRDYVELLQLGGTPPWMSSSLEYSAKRKVLPLPRGE